MGDSRQQETGCSNCGRPVPEGHGQCPACGTSVGWIESTRVTTVPVAGESDTQQRPAVVMVLEGKWELQDLIGKGGMGSVYRANDIQLRRTVAIKLLSVSLSSDPEFTTRFEREAHMMAKLEHANLMPIYAIGQHQGSPFIVMKYLEGQTLDMHAGGKPLPIEDVVSILRQLCAGLGFIHTRGVIHRDIKPANIFISPEGHVTILDLGLVRPQQQEGQGITRLGFVVGTPGYMAPEQATGARDLDHRADLYPLGVILFELVTGQRPFRADSDLELLMAQRDQVAPDVSALNPYIAPAVAAVVQKAMARMKDDRYGSAAELLKAFEKASRQVVSPSALRAELEKGSGPLSSSSAIGLGAKSAATIVRQATGPARKSRTVLSVALGAAVLLASLLLFVVSRPKADPPPMPGTSKVLPPSAAIPLAPVLVERPSLPTESPRPAAKEPVTPKVSLPPPRRAAAAAKGPMADGTLNIAVTLKGIRSWANVDLNGQRLADQAPTQLSLQPGNYKLSASQPGAAAIERKITIVSGKTQVVQLELKP